MAKYIHISKLDAAKRQLEIAIRLFFSDSDVIAIHTLTAAAHNLLRDLCKKQGDESFIKDGMFGRVKKEKLGEVRKMMTEAENFFKHADRDPDKLLKFYVELTEVFLLDDCIMYQTITKETPPLIRIFMMWFYLKYPDVFKDKKLIANAIEVTNEFGLTPENKSQFFLAFLSSNFKIIT